MEKIVIDDDAKSIGIKKDLTKNDESVKKYENKDDGPWNYKILLLLQKIGRKTMGYRWMHEQESIYYDDMDTKFRIAKRIIMALLGTIEVTSLYSALAGTGLEKNIIFKAVIAILNLIGIALLAIIVEYPSIVNFLDLKNSHANAAIRNAELNLAIQKQLTLNVVDRESDKMFLESVIRIFNNILFTSPSIRNVTKEKYMQEAEDNDIFNPLISDTNGLQIVIHDPQTNNENKESNETNLKYQIDRWLQHM